MGSAAERFAQLEDRILVDTGFTGARMRIAAVLAGRDPDRAADRPQPGLTRQALHGWPTISTELGLAECGWKES